MTDPLRPAAGTASSEEFPHGLRCSECSAVIPEGAPYWASPDGMVERFFVVELVCKTCARIDLT